MKFQRTKVHSVSPERPKLRLTSNIPRTMIASEKIFTLLPSAIPPEKVEYFHGKITREQAEDLLIAHGVKEGLFLLRESINRNYAISICHAARVHHYNVERQSDAWYRIQTGPLFVGPVEVVHYHTKHLDGFLTLACVPLKRKFGVMPVVLQGLHSDELERKLRLKATQMGLNGPSVTEALSGPVRQHLQHLVLRDIHTTQTWYHHTISRLEAERRLQEDGNQEGAFLVRFRNDDGSFVLSLCHEEEPKHYKIEEHLDRWSIEGGQYFETLIEMIDHYHHRQDGLLCKLRRPVWAPSHNHYRLGFVEIDSKFCRPTPKNSSAQTAINNSGVYGWNGSHSLPSLCSLAVTDTENEAFEIRDGISKRNLISFAEWPNVTRLLLQSRQDARNARGQSTSGNANHNAVVNQNSIGVTRFTSVKQYPTSKPSGDEHKDVIVSNVSKLTETSESCLQPIRVTTQHTTCRVKDEINAAIADVVSSAFRAARACTRRQSPEHSDTARLLSDYDSDRSVGETNNTSVTSLSNPTCHVGLHFPPVLDAPWEEPDTGEDLANSSNSGTSSSSGLGSLSFNTPTSVPCTNPFLPSQLTDTSRMLFKTHSSDVSTFCSARCCQLKSRPGQQLNVATTQSSLDHTQLMYDQLSPSNILLNSDSVSFLEPLGGGNFGHVMRGLYSSPSGKQVPVAIKTLKPCQMSNASECELLAEARTMLQLRHRHIVRLIGVCKEDHFMLVLELAPLGPINKYLKKHPDVPAHTLTELMYQVSLGMAYLESCKFVHRDLAARNVLLVTRHYAKISDFGMSKALNFGSDYYRAATAGKWPLKWYAPECIYYFRFDSKSDVWSFGITLWEVYSYGGRPYHNMKGAQILAMLEQGLRLSRPPRCPETIYSMMQHCWQAEGDQRPTFTELVLSLTSILKQMTGSMNSTLSVSSSSVQSNQFCQSRPSLTVNSSGGSGVNSGASDTNSF